MKMRSALLLMLWGMALTSPAQAFDGREQANATLIAALPASCPHDVVQWTQEDIPINLGHIFCGEIASGRKAKGLHARPNGDAPAILLHMEMVLTPDAQGVYAARITLAQDGRSAEKYSSFFPDHCDAHAVVASIRHAARHPSACPANAPRWASCGPGAPMKMAVEDAQKSGFCMGEDGSVIDIAIGYLQDGRINTAFPPR
ncbi:MAG: EndoU domain-containing protein [Pseudomonadota bacterium]